MLKMMLVLLRNFGIVCGIVRLFELSDSGCVLGNVDLLFRLVVMGIVSCFVSCCNCG